MIEFSGFEKSTGIVFKDKELLKQAFIHRSYINENPHSGMSHNERLEFLGDAVLELVVTDFLYKKYPFYTEGELTAIRSALVTIIDRPSSTSRYLCNSDGYSSTLAVTR